MAYSAPSLLPLLSFLSTFLVIVVFMITPIYMSKSRSLVLKLIHYDSIHSPFYNASETIADRAKRATDSSLARLAYLQAITSPALETENDYVLPVLPASSIFLANISIGTPSVVQMVIVDTGSSHLWVQCWPCDPCIKQEGPSFFPYQSSTYSVLPFDSPFCASLRLTRGENGECEYYIGYGDKSFTSGYLAQEMMKFETSQDGLVSVPDLIFGCGYRNRLTQFSDPLSGVLGIGPGPTSLVPQFGSKFSICLGNIHDPYYDFSHIIFGEDAVLEGIPTPLGLHTNHYHVTLEGISFGDKKLDIDPAILGGSESGLVIDTGATLTYLPQDAYNKIRRQVESFADREDWSESFKLTERNELCYRGSSSEDIARFPNITLHFAGDGGSEMVLDKFNLFRQVNVRRFCLAITGFNQDFGKSILGIIGVHSLQFYNVGVDIVEKEVYIERLDCEYIY